MTCCTSNVNPPARFRGHDGGKATYFFCEFLGQLAPASSCSHDPQQGVVLCVVVMKYSRQAKATQMRGKNDET